MDGIIGLGHFCETHGPCVILSTQRFTKEPQQKPHSLIGPLCEGCQSLQLDQAFLSRDNKLCYVTTRTPLLQEDAFLLRQATVRSLSCEIEGTRYFGDNERGHVHAQTFNVHDTLARGFHRKYCILVLMRDKLTLMSSCSIMSQHICTVIKYIIKSSEVVNQNEQAQRLQKSQRQSEGSLPNVLRSLTHLTKPGIYAHLHLWFAWILGCPFAVEESRGPSTLNFTAASSYLRILSQDMGKDMFTNILMLYLHGYSLKCKDEGVINAFKSIWPREYDFLKDYHGKPQCTLVKNDKWEIDCTIEINMPKSKLQKDLESLLNDERVIETTLGYQIVALIMPWVHNANVLLATPQVDINLLNSMNVAKNDVFLLSFIMSTHPKCDKVIGNINSVFDK